MSIRKQPGGTCFSLWLAAVALLGGCTGGDVNNPLSGPVGSSSSPTNQPTVSVVSFPPPPVRIVVENLTTEARHQENARITINYIDASGNLKTYTTDPLLNAVPLSQRDPSKPNFDSSYREVIYLDGGVREIWFTGQVYRTRITTKPATVGLGNASSQQITYCTASISRQPATLTDNATSMTTINFDNYSAFQLFPAHLLETQDFKSGDVIFVGLLDQRLQNQAIDVQPEACDYVDLSSLSKAFVSTDQAVNAANPKLAGDNIPGAFRPFYLFDPNQDELTGSEGAPGEYLYPVGYLLIPMVLQNIADIDGALAIIEQTAAQNATH